MADFKIKRKVRIALELSLEEAIALNELLMAAVDGNGQNGIYTEIYNALPSQASFDLLKAEQGE